MSYKRNKNMPGFENKPYSKDDYDKNTEDAESLKKQMVGAKTADEMMAIAMKMKAAEGNEKELMGNAQEEAGKKNEERKAYDEAVAEDTERTTAKESEKMDADLENLKGQIVGAKNADEMMEIAGKIKEIEEKKKEIGAGSQKEESEKRGKELEELKLKDETGSAKKAEEILKKLNGEDVKSLESMSKESKEMSPDAVYERFRGTTSYDKDGKIEGMYPALRNNAKFMLGSFNKSRGNILEWASKQLMSDPTFLEQLKNVYGKKYGSGSKGMIDAERYISDITDSRYHKYDEVVTEDVPDDFIENVREKAAKSNKESGWEQNQAKEISQIEKSFLERGKYIDEMEKKMEQAEQVFESQIGVLKSMDAGGAKRDAFLKLRGEVLKNGWGENYYTISERLDNPEGFKESTLNAAVDSMRYGLKKIDEANPVVSELSQKISDFEQRVKNITQREQNLLSKIQKARFESDPAFAK